MRQESSVERAMLLIPTLDCWKAPNSGQEPVEGDYGRDRWAIDQDEALLKLKSKSIAREDGLEAFRRHRIAGRLEVQTSLLVFRAKDGRLVPMQPERVIFFATEKMDLWRQEQAEKGATEPPKEYLTSWRAIVVALVGKYSDEVREQVRNLNDQYNGPIVIPKQGAQAKVNRKTLLAWWNGLEIQWAAGHNRARDARPTVEARHPYGRDGTAAPDIGGGVKKPRADRQN